MRIFKVAEKLTAGKATIIVKQIGNVKRILALCTKIIRKVSSARPHPLRVPGYNNTHSFKKTTTVIEKRVPK